MPYAFFTKEVQNLLMGKTMKLNSSKQLVLGDTRDLKFELQEQWHSGALLVMFSVKLDSFTEDEYCSILE